MVNTAVAAQECCAFNTYLQIILYYTLLVVHLGFYLFFYGLSLGCGGGVEIDMVIFFKLICKIGLLDAANTPCFCLSRQR